MLKFSFILGAVLSAATANAAITASSGEAAGKQAVDLSGSFADQKKSIETNLADGETYSEISRQDRDQVRSALQRISSTLEITGSVDTLSDVEKAQVFNDQELVNTLLTSAGEDSRLICKREKKVGSNRTTTQCETVGQRRRAAEDSQKAMRDNQRVMMPQGR
ncbi:MAG: hypothetical protein ABIP44_00135 [Pseudoxanthomonas sp.]